MVTGPKIIQQSDPRKGEREERRGDGGDGVKGRSGRWHNSRWGEAYKVRLSVCRSLPPIYCMASQGMCLVCACGNISSPLTMSSFSECALFGVPPQQDNPTQKSNYYDIVEFRYTILHDL